MSMFGCTGLHYKALPRLCEFGVKNCVFLPAVGKQSAIFYPITHNLGRALKCSPVPYNA